MSTQTRRQIIREIHTSETAPVVAPAPVAETVSTGPKKMPVAIQREVAAKAATYIQACALRLEMSKKEELAKTELSDLLSAYDLTYYEGKFMLDGKPVSVEFEFKSGQTTVIDIEKLTLMLTPEQFKSVAKVTLTAAKEVLPQALIDQCSTTTSTPATLKIKPRKGYPVPTVTLYPVQDEPKAK